MGECTRSSAYIALPQGITMLPALNLDVPVHAGMWVASGVCHGARVRLSDTDLYLAKGSSWKKVGGKEEFERRLKKSSGLMRLVPKGKPPGTVPCILQADPTGAPLNVPEDLADIYGITRVSFSPQNDNDTVWVEYLPGRDPGVASVMVLTQGSDHKENPNSMFTTDPSSRVFAVSPYGGRVRALRYLAAEARDNAAFELLQRYAVGYNSSILALKTASAVVGYTMTGPVGPAFHVARTILSVRAAILSLIKVSKEQSETGSVSVRNSSELLVNALSLATPSLGNVAELVTNTADIGLSGYDTYRASKGDFKGVRVLPVVQEAATRKGEAAKAATYSTASQEAAELSKGLGANLPHIDNLASYSVSQGRNQVDSLILGGYLYEDDQQAADAFEQLILGHEGLISDSGLLSLRGRFKYGMLEGGPEAAVLLRKPEYQLLMVSAYVTQEKHENMSELQARNKVPRRKTKAYKAVNPLPDDVSKKPSRRKKYATFVSLTA